MHITRHDKEMVCNLAPAVLLGMEFPVLPFAHSVEWVSKNERATLGGRRRRRIYARIACRDVVNTKHLIMYMSSWRKEAHNRNHHWTAAAAGGLLMITTTD